MWGVLAIINTICVLYGIYLLTGSIVIVLILCFIYMSYIPSNNWWIRGLWIFKYAKNVHHQVKYMGPGVALLSDDNNTYCFGMHPHGPHAVASIVGIAANLDFKNVRIVASTVLFWIPIVKEFMGWGNCLKATRSEMHRALHHGSSIALFPAGNRETVGLFPEEQKGNDLYIFPRSSFIEIAKANSVPIVPVWIDGEYYTYKTYWPFLRFSQYCYKKIRYPFPLISLGWYGSPIPKPVPMTFYVGNAINTTTHTIEELQDIFYTKLIELQNMSIK